MTTLDSVNELFDTLKESIDGSPETKVLYAAGYLKGLMASYVPQDVIERHIKHLKENV